MAPGRAPRRHARYPASRCAPPAWITPSRGGLPGAGARHRVADCSSRSTPPRSAARSTRPRVVDCTVGARHRVGIAWSEHALAWSAAPSTRPSRGGLPVGARPRVVDYLIALAGDASTPSRGGLPDRSTPLRGRPPQSTRPSRGGLPGRSTPSRGGLPGRSTPRVVDHPRRRASRGGLADRSTPSRGRPPLSTLPSCGAPPQSQKVPASTGLSTRPRVVRRLGPNTPVVGRPRRGPALAWAARHPKRGRAAGARSQHCGRVPSRYPPTASAQLTSAALTTEGSGLVWATPSITTVGTVSLPSLTLAT